MPCGGVCIYYYYAKIKTGHRVNTCAIEFRSIELLRNLPFTPNIYACAVQITFIKVLLLVMKIKMAPGKELPADVAHHLSLMNMPTRPQLS